MSDKIEPPFEKLREEVGKVLKGCFWSAWPDVMKEVKRDLSLSIDPWYLTIEGRNVNNEIWLSEKLEDLVQECCKRAEEEEDHRSMQKLFEGLLLQSKAASDSLSRIKEGRTTKAALQKKLGVVVY
jgi:hypothetical protein